MTSSAQQPPKRRQPPERQRLRAEIEARQEALGEIWDEIASRGGTHAETIRRVRVGTSPITVKTRADIERGLRWAPGSIRAVLEGGDPTPEPGSPGSKEAPEGGRYSAATIDLGDRVVHLARDLNASARGQGVPPDEAAEMTRRALERALGAAEGTGLLALEHELRKWRTEHEESDDE